MMLAAPPLNTAGAKVMVSAPLVLLLAIVASRSEMPSPPLLAIKATIEVVFPLVRSVALLTVTPASSCRSSRRSKFSVVFCANVSERLGIRDPLG